MSLYSSGIGVSLAGDEERYRDSGGVLFTSHSSSQDPIADGDSFRILGTSLLGGRGYGSLSLFIQMNIMGHQLHALGCWGIKTESDQLTFQWGRQTCDQVLLISV